MLSRRRLEVCDIRVLRLSSANILQHDLAWKEGITMRSQRWLCRSLTVVQYRFQSPPTKGEISPARRWQPITCKACQRSLS